MVYIYSRKKYKKNNNATEFEEFLQIKENFQFLNKNIHI
jgi:hypothetical protein